MNGVKKIFHRVFCGQETDKKYLEPVINHLPDAFIIIDHRGIVTSVNKACCNLLGYDESEIIGQSASLFFVDINAPEQGQNEIYLGKILDRLVLKGYVNNLEVIFLTKSKKKIPIMFNGVVLRDKKNNITGVLGLARDIREIKRNMGKIRVLQKISLLTLKEKDISVMMKDIGNYIKEFFEVERATYYMVDNGYLKSVYASDYQEKITLKIPEGIAGYSIDIKKSYYTNDAYADPHFYPLIDKQSGYKTKNILVCPVLEKYEVIGLVELINKDEDFTEQDKNDLEEMVNLARFVIFNRQKDIKLKELSKFPEENPNMVIRATNEGKILYFNPASECFMKFFSCNVGGDLPDKLRKVVIESAKDPADKKLEINCFADRIIFFTIKHIASENYVNLYGLDVTEQKLAEKSLLASEERYTHLIENIPVGIYRNTSGPKGRFLLINPAIARMFGYNSVEEFLKISVADLYDCPEERKAFSDLLSSKGEVKSYEIKLKRKDGQQIWGSITAKAIRDKKGDVQYFDGIIEDITERTRAEDEKVKLQSQLIHQSQLASIGELASGLAHEIGNPLQTVLGNAELLLMDTKNEELLAIKNASLHCKKIIKNLLDFSRQREMNFIPEDINKLLEKTLSLYGKQLELGKIKVVKNYGKLPKITVSPSHIKQVFLNLITNTQKAMPKGGTLTISTSVVAELAPKGTSFGRSAISQPRLETTEEPDFIEISFKDTGIGIPKENVLRLFEPFFTTRKDGSGLGLSVSYGIVKQHGGEITVFSDGENKGAEFVVKLPVNFVGGKC